MGAWLVLYMEQSKAQKKLGILSMLKLEQIQRGQGLA